jgi:hypothetical protein
VDVVRLSGARERIEQKDCVLATVAGEVAVVAIDHREARAHVAGEIERGDAGTEGEGGEGVPQVVDPTERLDASRALRGSPMAAAEVVQVDDHGHALGELRALAGELERSHPGAAASLREGLEETLTLTRLGIRGNLKRTLESTNPCESMIECVRRSARNVKRWQSGEMCLRWTAAGMLEAERQFRRIIGYQDLAKLVVAIDNEREHGNETSTPTEEGAIVVTA